MLKGYQKCVNCGNDISCTAVFRIYCGARQAPEYTASAPGGVYKKCGAPVEEGQVFCTECGARIEASKSNQEPMPKDVSEPLSVKQDFASRSDPELKQKTVSEPELVIKVNE